MEELSRNAPDSLLLAIGCRQLTPLPVAAMLTIALLANRRVSTLLATRCRALDTGQRRVPLLCDQPRAGTGCRPRVGHRPAPFATAFCSPRRSLSAGQRHLPCRAISLALAGGDALHRRYLQRGTRRAGGHRKDGGTAIPYHATYSHRLPFPQEGRVESKRRPRHPRFRKFLRSLEQRFVIDCGQGVGVGFHTMACKVMPFSWCCCSTRPTKRICSRWARISATAIRSAS